MLFPIFCHGKKLMRPVVIFYTLARAADLVLSVALIPHPEKYCFLRLQIRCLSIV